ncbi:RISC-loading complex subunit tarbp2 [Orussus abietinus]|uniref:RISC-loading complex subunit tarbp2 n=1 Tax=Orussus abietinus TaxID=222816 RepID=UPI000625F5CE|nr:RISC-loading complex subunit tarbp2 [Orussus abietinus]
MNKTPVSILQEMMVRKGTAPNYELIYDGGGSHNNKFIFQVSCDGLTATGGGRCKKDAKHEAAKAMLELIVKQTGIEVQDSPMPSPVHNSTPAVLPVSPKTNVPFVNAIGALQDLCAENNLQEPLYNAINEVGPPHAKVFTVQCVVSTFKEEGTATTKKQAKHEAARKMLHRLHDVVSDLKDISHSENQNKLKQQDILSSELAKARYPELSKQHIQKKSSLGAKLSEYHLRLMKNFQESAPKFLEKITSLIEMISKGNTNMDVVKTEFQNLLTMIEADMESIPMESDTEKMLMAVQLNTCPIITEVGSGATESLAELNAIVQVMKTLKLLFT